MTQFKIECIASYPKVFKAEKYKGRQDAKAKYTISALVKDGSPAYLEAKKAFDEEKANTFPKNNAPKDARWAMKASDDFPGYHVISTAANEEYKPVVCDMEGKPVGPGDLVGGSKIWLIGNFFGYEEGVAAGVNGVIVTGEMGELGKLGGGETKESMLAEVQKLMGIAPALKQPNAELAAQGHTRESLMASYPEADLIAWGWLV